jgi:hypothetical protein
VTHDARLRPTPAAPILAAIMNATSPAVMMVLNLGVAAIAAVLAVRILRGVLGEGPAGAIAVVTHLAVAYLVNTTFWPPLPVPLAAGLAAACGVAFAIRLAARRRDG